MRRTQIWCGGVTLIMAACSGESSTTVAPSLVPPPVSPAPQSPTDDAESDTSYELDDGSEISACLGAARNRQWLSTLDLLERIVPPEFTAGTPPATCMTDVWARADPAAATVDRAIHRDFEQRERARRTAWLESFPRNVVWLRAFIPGFSRAVVRGSAVTYASKPGLMSVIDARGITDVANPQFCAVLAAEVTGDTTIIFCGEPGNTRDSSAFTVHIAEPTVRARLGELAIGDVVRFEGYLALVGEVPRGESSVSRWRFDDVPASGVEVVARGTCCRRGSTP